MTFKVGDVCLIVGCKTDPYVNGLECTIIEGLQTKSTFGFGDVQVYKVHLQTGQLRWAFPDVLRKKPPPRKDLEVVEWNSVPWVPKELIS